MCLCMLCVRASMCIHKFICAFIYIYINIAYCVHTFFAWYDTSSLMH